MRIKKIVIVKLFVYSLHTRDSGGVSLLSLLLIKRMSLKKFSEIRHVIVMVEKTNTPQVTHFKRF